MRRALFVVSLVLTTVALAPAAARADDASESRTRRELGQEYYRQGRYQEALDMFLEAYRLVPMPTLAHDVAQTYALLDRPVQAFNWYQTFLRASEGDEHLASARAETESALGTLAPRVALLQLTSDPPGAEVFVDRVELGSWGTTPVLLAIPGGAHTLTFRAAGHHDGTQPVEATIGATVALAITLPPILGTLVVSTEPSGATIENERSGEVLGTTPLRVEVPVGELRIRARRDGWVDAQRTVDVSEAQETSVSITLPREASTVAVLSVEGEPEGARVLVDDRDVGAVPLTLDTIGVGTHRVRVESAGLEGISREVVLEAGGATRLAVTLRPPSSWEWPALRWIGYGVGAATVIGGAVAGGMALVQRDAFFADPTRAALDTQRSTALSADVLVATGTVILAVTLVLDLTLQPPATSEATVSLDR